MKRVTTVGATIKQKETAVMRAGKKSTEKLIEIMTASQGTARAELVRKILGSALLLSDRVYVDECAQLDSFTLRHVFNVLRSHAAQGSDYQIWMCISGYEYCVRNEPFENDCF
jgi:hypothetical protein